MTMYQRSSFINKYKCGGRRKAWIGAAIGAAGSLVGGMFGSKGQQLLRRCDELWVCGDRISSGMAREISEANHLSIPVKNIGAHEIQKEQLPAEMEQVTASGQGLGMT